MVDKSKLNGTVTQLDPSRMDEKPAEAPKRVNPYKGQLLEISEHAKELFEREQGIRYALQYISEQAGRANAAAWREVYKQYPEIEKLDGMFAVFEEKDGKIRVVDPSDADEAAKLN